MSIISPLFFKRLTQWLRFAVRRALQERITEVAGSLTFTTVLSLVPLLAIALSVFTAFPLFQDFREALEEYLVDSFLPANIADSIMTYMNQFADKAKRLTAVGIGFLIFTAISLMLTVDRILNEIWHVREPRSLLQRVLIYWAGLSIGPLLIGASLWATSVAVSVSAGWIQGMPLGIVEWLSWVPVLLTSAGFVALFMTVPNRRVRFSDALLGGVVAGVGFELLKRGFGWYVTQYPTYTLVYGTLATIPIFLLWVYLSWLVILFAATLAASLRVFRDPAGINVERAGGDWVHSIDALRALAEARHNQPAGLTQSALRRHLHIGHDSMERLLDKLEASGLVGQVIPRSRQRSDRPARWVLLNDPSDITLSPLARRLLLDPEQPRLRADAQLNELVLAAWPRFDQTWPSLAALLEHAAKVTSGSEAPETPSTVPSSPIEKPAAVEAYPTGARS